MESHCMAGLLFNDPRQISGGNMQLVRIKLNIMIVTIIMYQQFLEIPENLTGPFDNGFVFKSV